MSGRQERAILGAAAAVLATVSLAPARGVAVTQSWSATGVIRVDGESTLHKWSAKTSTFRARMAVQAQGARGPEALVRARAVTGMTVSVPVRTLSSGDRGLDGNMYQALEAKRHPSITFTMSSYELVPGRGTDFAVRAKGTLSIAGVTKPVTLTVRGTATKGGLHLTGSRRLVMTDFGIKPPTFFFGAMKVTPAVLVSFDLRVMRPSGASTER